MTEISKKTFKKEVFIKVPVEVTLDSEVFNEQYLKDFSSYIHQVDSLEEIAEFIALNVAIFDNPSIDFVGTPMVRGEIPHGVEEKYVNKHVDVKFPYFKYDDRLIGDSFLLSEFEDSRKY